MKVKEAIELLQALGQPEAELKVRDDETWIPLGWIIHNEEGKEVYLQAEDS